MMYRYLWQHIDARHHHTLGLLQPLVVKGRLDNPQIVSSTKAMLTTFSNIWNIRKGIVMFDSCECGWKNQSKDTASSSRSAVGHMRRCPLRTQKAVGTKSLSKRGISDTESSGVEGTLLEPPQKIPRLLPVSAHNVEAEQLSE